MAHREIHGSINASRSESYFVHLCHDFLPPYSPKEITNEYVMWISSDSGMALLFPTIRAHKRTVFLMYKEIITLRIAKRPRETIGFFFFFFFRESSWKRYHLPDRIINCCLESLSSFKWKEYRTIIIRNSIRILVIAFVDWIRIN